MQYSTPDDLVLVGHITGAYGIRGWVRIKPYSAHADALLYAKTWWLDRPQMQDVERLEVKMHSLDVVARLVGIEDREAAEALKGATVSVSRRHFPPLAQGEYYWVDLIGTQVVSAQGERLGVVRDMMDNGAHPILQVQHTDEASGTLREQLIPFVPHVVLEVDLPARTIRVDWGSDY